MESAEDLQNSEITALKSIYAEQFLECPASNVWKGAPKQPEFILKVVHPDESHADKIYFHLHVKFPKTYPLLAYPIFTIQKPIQGLTSSHVTKLAQAIHAEAQNQKGSEMVFQIVTFAQDWLSDNIKPPAEVVGSLATLMSQRALEEERARKEREQLEAEQELERVQQRAQRLTQEIEADAQRQELEKQKHYKARRRAESDATEVPPAGDTPTETFAQEVRVRDINFHTVKLFHPKRECLGMTYLAEPVCDDVHATLPLELYVVTFESQYYSTSQGRKKLKQLELDIQKLISVRHENLVSLYAAKLAMPHAMSESTRLAILCEQRPPVTLLDVLENCDTLKEERATEYLLQILSALQAIHEKDLIHRGLNLRCICLGSDNSQSRTKIVKVRKACYYGRLLDLHRSNPFGLNVPNGDESAIPEAWLPKDAVDSPLLYTRSRDIHCAGVVLLQMLLGRDVMQRFGVPQLALQACDISPTLYQVASSMLTSGRKKAASCHSLIRELSGSIISPGIRIRDRAITFSDVRTPVVPHNFSGSPEEYFAMPAQRTRHSSRWKEDWEELELLGKGAFGSVVKARNKIDSRIYAVKKVKLRATQKDTKIFREVNALSRLSHRFIVRYYTTWVETSDPFATPLSSGSDSEESGTENGMISFRAGKRKDDFSNDPFSIDLDDLQSGAGSKSSFPSIHFTRSGSSKQADNETDNEYDDNDSDEADPNFLELLDNGQANGNGSASPALTVVQEFVERQTLKERIAEGLSEDEAWRLFMQIVDALVHMSSLGILHRDIKLTNIFIDGKGDCKVGDFGLATSSLAAVDPSDVAPGVVGSDDMTLEVGTRLYIAPEVQSHKNGPRRSPNKADMYSLGIVFFEMNYMFSTGAERIAVIEMLRKPEIIFPSGWDPHRVRQREIIHWLLQHDPNERPSALELSQSPLLPPRVEDEYFRGAIRMMAKQDSPHYQAVLSALFNQQSKPSRAFLYDKESRLPEHASLNDIVEQTLTSIFQLHGAVHMEPLQLMPAMNPENEHNRVLLLDRHGEVVALPNDALVPFARLAARDRMRRVKRFHVGNVYRPNVTAGHPKSTKAAVFDIISPDMECGPAAAIAESLAIVNKCLDSFPGIGQDYEIQVSHSMILEYIFHGIPEDTRQPVLNILTRTKSSWPQKRTLLLNRGLLRSTADELEILSETYNDVESVIVKLEKASSSVLALINPAIKEVKRVLEYATGLGVSRRIHFRPLMLGTHNAPFKDGVCFEVTRRGKRTDILAAGGRYDSMIRQFTPPDPKSDSFCAMGFQLAIDKITSALAAFQSTSVRNLVKEQRSFGFWSPRRCDVYIVSYHPGYLLDRLEVAALLWANDISADVMYESGLPDSEDESHADLCSREGILFTVVPRPRTIKREQAAFKVRNMLKGTEYDISRAELVGWLQQQIAEQKKVDSSTSGVSAVPDLPIGPVAMAKENSSASDIQLLLPGETKKQLKRSKQMFMDRAFDTASELKSSIQTGLPVIAVDVPSLVFEALVRDASWVTDEDTWKAILAGLPSQHSGYGNQIRDAVARRKAEGRRFVLLFAVREERLQVLDLS
ncbi:Serine/threonine-protein kinase [Heliocybe sulcata]|uniref:non-specific serine/threonine protein kinase n=1 Tax=Heliocybe sulcata TaxID=5364 RepID=A0A5C3MUF9_9AGAM|nr:Serine/threonine-protein kinase [Heliocybe sulcata]